MQATELTNSNDGIGSADDMSAESRGWNTDYGVWFQSTVSGLWYCNEKAAGSVSEVKVDGKLFKPVR